MTTPQDVLVAKSFYAGIRFMRAVNISFFLQMARQAVVPEHRIAFGHAVKALLLFPERSAEQVLVMIAAVDGDFESLVAEAESAAEGT